MKKLFFTLLFLAVAVIAPSAHAAEVKTDDQVLVRDTDVVNDDVYAAGETVRIEGTVKGDVVAFAGKVIITGSVEGDLTVFGGDVTVSGTIGDDIRMFGGTISVTGEISDEALVFGGDVLFEKDSKVFGDLITYSGKISLEGSIDGHARLGGGDIRIAGPMSANVDVHESGKLRLEEGALIGGDLTYATDEMLSTAEQARVQGKVTYHEPVAKKSQQWFVASYQNFVAHEIWWHAYLALSLILLSLALVWLFPQAFRRVSTGLVPDTLWRNLGVGVLTFIGAPLIALVLLLTLIGAPLALFLIMAYVLLWMLSSLPAAYVVGEYVLRRMKKQTSMRAIMVIGVLIVELVFLVLSLVPLIGSLVIFLVKVWGLGSLVSSLRPRGEQKA